jgi:hypothetical protein
MNKVSGAARSMGKANRQETLDRLHEGFKLEENSWDGQVLFSKPIPDIYVVIFLVPTLLTKLKRSQTGLNSTQPAFDQLTQSCIQQKLPVESWRLDEDLAMEERGERLKIFDVNHEKAPTLAQITLQLCDAKGSSMVQLTLWIG